VKAISMINKDDDDDYDSDDGDVVVERFPYELT